MNPKLLVVGAKYFMWALTVLILVGWFVEALARRDAGGALFIALCVLGLLLVPLAMTRLHER